MLIGVISDTHIPERAASLPPDAFDAFREVDRILHAGDLTDISVLAELEAIAPVAAVFGNMDGPEARSRLKEKAVLEIGGARIGLAHGSGKPDDLPERMRLAFGRDEVDAVVFGHSHRAFSQRLDGVLMFNPGSPTDTSFGRNRSVGLLRIGPDGIETKIVPIP